MWGTMAEKDLRFGERLRDKILEAGLNKKKVAERIGVSPGAMTNYIRAGRIPEAPILSALAQLLKTTVEELLKGPATKEGEARSVEALVRERDQAYSLAESLREKEILREQLERILREGNRAKIEAVRAQLVALDPGKKKGG